jgi:hypothetical protein
MAAALDLATTYPQDAHRVTVSVLEVQGEVVVVEEYLVLDQTSTQWNGSILASSPFQTSLLL